MAKIVIEFEDQTDGGLVVRFAGDEVLTAKTRSTNTPAQNAAIYLAQQMREVGLDAPDLSGEGAKEGNSSVSYFDEGQYLLSEGRRIGAFNSAPKAEEMAMTTEQTQRLVDSWNRVIRIGTKVTYQKSDLEGSIVVQTVDSAYVFAGESAVELEHIGTALLNKVKPFYG